MMELLESPWPVIFFGMIALAILAVALVRTGRGAILWIMGGVVAVTLFGLLLEWLVVTQRESIEDILYGAAAAVEANDGDALVQCISSNEAALGRHAKYVLKQYRFSEARLTDVAIEINDLTSPPSAEAKVLGVFSLVDTKAKLPYTNGRVLLHVQLELEEEGWRVVGYRQGNSRDHL